MRRWAVVWMLLALAGCASSIDRRATPSADGVGRLTSGYVPSEELWIIATPTAAAAQSPAAAETPALIFTGLEVAATIADDAAVVVVRQQFANGRAVPVDAVIHHPWGAGATLTDFVVAFGNRRIRGILRPEEEARELFIAAGRNRLPAVLIEVDPSGLLRQRLASVPAQTPVELQLTYVDPLTFRDGWYGWRYVWPGYAKDASSEKVRLRVGLEVASIDRVESPSHAIELLTRSPSDAGGARLATSPAGRDFELRFRLTSGAAALPAHPPIMPRGSGIAVDASPARAVPERETP